MVVDTSFTHKLTYQLVVKGSNAVDVEYSIYLDFESALQDLIVTLGFLGACFLAIYKVTHHTKTIGDFVALFTYWAQLQGNLMRY